MRKRIALVAHDSRKQELKEWVEYNKEVLKDCELYATGTTGTLLQECFLVMGPSIVHELPNGDRLATADIKFTYTNTINKLHSGPLGGDQEIGAMIANGKLDVVIFFCDNLITQGHAQDIQALSRLASLYNIAYANNRTTADMIITSPLFNDPDYEMQVPACITTYANRFNDATAQK
jgi:methylglyoxal synthase